MCSSSNNINVSCNQCVVDNAVRYVVVDTAMVVVVNDNVQWLTRRFLDKDIKP